MARGRPKHRGRVGEAPLDSLEEAAEQAGQGAQAFDVLTRTVSLRGEGEEALGSDPRPAQGDEGLGEGAGQRCSGQPFRHGQAVRAVEKARGEKRGVPRVPGAQSLTE